MFFSAFVGGYGGVDVRSRASPNVCRPSQRRGWTVRASATLDDGEKSKRVQDRLQFWFSEANVKRDWFLRSKMSPDGWVKADVFLKFNTLKVLGLTTDMVMDAASTLDGVEIDQETKSIRGVSARPSLERNLLAEQQKIVFLTGLGPDANLSVVKNEIQNLVEPEYIGIGRFKDRRAKGWALLELRSEEETNQFLTNFNEKQRDDSEIKALSYAVFHEQSRIDRTDISVEMCVLHVTNIPLGTVWRDLWEEFKTIGGIYLSYKSGDSTEALLKVNALNVVTKFESGLVSVNGVRLDAELLSLEEQDKYTKLTMTGEGLSNSDIDIESPVERILALVKSKPDNRGGARRTLEITGLPEEAGFRKLWLWLQEQSAGVRFMLRDKGSDKADLFFSSSERMKAFIEYLEGGGLVLGTEVSHREWTADEVTSHYIKRREEAAKVE
ncbi:hypothetical protein NDN08_004299 [Rhodosorus marinus]|uniref:HTH La-type RNA-binding domain-containing protein n=1 Tax=Rhodosorus marinus TaxID=101924 RepID=A0AAV8UMD3_9RHOD|nr:hypothetical protein NDN08_004299 [Rhodosorus marinus]